MVGKKKITKEVKPNAKTYFGRRLIQIEAFCKGKTKDEQIKQLKGLLADSKTQSRIILDSWSRTLDAWRFWSKFHFMNILAAILLGICLGAIIFA